MKQGRIQHHTAITDALIDAITHHTGMTAEHVANRILDAIEDLKLKPDSERILVNRDDFDALHEELERLDLTRTGNVELSHGVAALGRVATAAKRVMASAEMGDES